MKRLLGRWLVAVSLSLVAACGDASLTAPTPPTEVRTSESPNNDLGLVPDDGYVDTIHCSYCLTEIVVIACGPGYYRDETSDRCIPYNSGGQVGGSGGWGEGGGGGSNGGGSPSYDSPIGEPIANDEDWECDSVRVPLCDLQDPTLEHRQQAQNETNKIRNDGICGQAKAMAQTMLNTPEGFKVWTNRIQRINPETGIMETVVGDQTIKYTHPTGVEHIKVMHLWTGGGINAWTIAHEALHALGGDHQTTYNNPDGTARSLDSTAKFCSGA